MTQHPIPEHDFPTLTDGLPTSSSQAPEAMPTSGLWAGPPEDPARYELLEAVGTGAEGTTYRAQYTAEVGAAPVVVAIKAYRPPAGAPSQWPHDGTWRRITQQQALLAALPPDPHLVQVRDAFLGAFFAPSGSDAPRLGVVGASTPFVVMQWVTGAPPEDLLSRSVPLADRLDWVADLAQAIRALHSMTVDDGNALVHGDIKPSNCLITPEGSLVLLDLGAASHIASTSSPRGLHTPAFAAPEVIAAPKGHRSAATDTYSLAATAFVLLTGERPDTSSPSADQRTERLLASAVGALPRRTRSHLQSALLAGLSPTPETRRHLDAGPWRRAARSHRRRFRRRTALASGATAAVAAAVVVLMAVMHVGPFRLAVDDETRTIRWDRLAATAPLPDERVLADSSQTWGGWVAAPPQLVAETSGGLAVTAGEAGATTLVTAPTRAGSSREVVEVSASTDGQQGMWGVWCRGTEDGGQRYRFLYSHAGAVAISALVQDDSGAITENTTGWWWLTGVDSRRPVVVEGRCLDGSAGAELEMLVNGRSVLSYRPTGRPLSTGSSGVEARGFTDVEGPAVTATFTRFTDSSAA